MQSVLFGMEFSCNIAGLSPSDWTPQYNYWLRPKELEDRGENVLA